MKERQRQAHMEAARVYAGLSYCVRRKVGCVVVKDNKIISIGYNGTPPGACNTCEGHDGLTLPSVIHAEINALKKLDVGDAGEGAVLFVTTSPCVPCAEEIMRHEITHVIYDEQYFRTDGITYLRDRGVTVEQIDYMGEDTELKEKT